jgi:hypothetical protein
VPGGGGSEHSNESVRDLINHNCYLNSTKALVDNTQKREILSYALQLWNSNLRHPYLKPVWSTRIANYNSL